MLPGGGLPIYLQTEVGYAQWWLTHPGRGPNTGVDIINRLVARGYVPDRATARAVLSQARQNITATGRIQGATVRSSLRAACGYRCPPSTPIALRVRMDVTDAAGNVVQSRSIVIQATAGENLQDVLDRARQRFNQRYTRGTAHRSGQLQLTRQLSPADVDAVLLNYTQGTP